MQITDLRVVRRRPRRSWYARAKGVCAAWGDSVRPMSMGEERRPRPGQLAREAYRLGARNYFAYRRLRMAAPEPGLQTPVCLSLAPINGAPAVLRSHSSDVLVVRDTFVGRFHLPPLPLRDDALIFDLGANIGLTAAHFAVLEPASRIVAVEMDPINAALCELNTATWSDRITTINAAVWTERGEVSYVGERGDEFGFHIPGADERVGAVARTVSSRTLVDLVAEYGVPDYVKMDIEGAEREVLGANDGWSDGVGGMKVELHGSYAIADAVRDLERLGFAVRPDPKHHAAVIAVRP